ncbi:hypothetical protein [Rhizobium halophilum]|uniref:hypothetical protein n=1 Tax=Rhizobium halophilum TaxID=2846852 RepID=UPI001EFD2358|nr:hypothetical protein [Rhizobium halophilum]MCF6371057.1 hypothetical protein [Rhizobium halophilum]
MVEITAINHANRLAVTNDGRLGEVTNLFDRDGDDTDDTEAAVAAVVKLADDEWLTVDLATFETARLN